MLIIKLQGSSHVERCYGNDIQPAANIVKIILEFELFNRIVSVFP